MRSVHSKPERPTKQALQAVTSCPFLLSSSLPVARAARPGIQQSGPCCKEGCQQLSQRLGIAAGLHAAQPLTATLREVNVISWRIARRREEQRSSFRRATQAVGKCRTHLQKAVGWRLPVLHWPLGAGTDQLADGRKHCWLAQLQMPDHLQSVFGEI